ncbi:MAG TPA: DUF2255 family protein [Candidatus Limnocylindria bacterium]|jgi:hypothetical protein
MTDEERELLRAAREVRIETSRGEGAPVHRTIIWVVVDDADRVLVRTYLGPGSRWYREALASGRVRLVSGERAIDFSVEAATDPDRMEACSDALRAKYRRSVSLDAMLRDEVLGTTLELHPHQD